LSVSLEVLVVVLDIAVVQAVVVEEGAEER
jgi:hypothetical protein